MDLYNKIIWVTGASSGIGEALVKALCKYNTKLIISSRNEDELMRVKNEAETREGNITVLPVDLENNGKLKKITNDACSIYGDIDILINNAGISQRSLAVETGIDVDRRIMEIDYFGTITLTKHVLTRMIKNKSGHIVVISSIMGKIGTPLRSAYCAAKHALHGFFDSLRAEIWMHNIGITIICPAAVRTSISINSLTGNGASYGIMDSIQDEGLSPQKAAEKIINGIIKGKEEIVIGKGPVKYAVLVKRFFPFLFSRILRNAKVT